MIKKLHSYHTYVMAPLLLSAAGLLASLYLSISHYRNYTDLTYSSFCAISKSINCDTVSQSSWSILLGIPLAIWGLFAYFVFLVFVLFAMKNTQERRYLWDFLFILSLVYLCADIYFGYIAAIKIKAYCVVCLFTYGITLFLLFFTWIIRRRFNNHNLFIGFWKSILSFSTIRRLRFSTIALITVFILLVSYMPHYWIVEYPELSSDINTGVTSEGHPWIGAENPELIINEFSDYQCFQCSKMHLTLRYLVNEHSTTIRLVHYHYPMDERFNTILVKEKFHTGSGDLALLAIAAGLQGKFWKTNDALYSIARQEITAFNIRKFAKKMNLDEKKLKKDMYSEEVVKILENDIRTGLKKSIIGTPSYIIDNKTYAGHLPANILSLLSDD